MFSIDFYRNGGTPLLGVPPFVTIKPGENSTQVKRVMGENQLNITFQDSRYISFTINDSCSVFGEQYYLSQVPIVTKISQFLYNYTLQMNADGFNLSKAQFLFLGPTNTLRESDFSLMGNADDFVNLIIANANRISSGWTKGQVVPSNYKNLTFSQENCYNAISRIAEEFQTEFAIEGKTVHLVKRTEDTGHTYKHGRNRGLYEITRQTLNNSSIVTRLYAYGSEKNLPASYITTGKRLRFPGGYNPCLISNMLYTVVNNGNGTQTITFNWTAPITPGVTAVSIEYRLAGTTNSWIINTGGHNIQRVITIPVGTYEFRFRTHGAACDTFVTPVITVTVTITIPVYVYTPLPYIERNTTVYGIIEHTEIFENIYPRRTGIVTAVNAGDAFEFFDANINFDVNSFLLPGLTAKVTFNTGQLAGYTFDLESFNNGTKKFRVQKNADERILTIPNATMRPGIGDQYVLTDISMPSTYVTDAENELLAAANARLVELSEPQLAYSIVIDPVFMKRVNRTIKIGDMVWIVDTELEVQKKIRVVSVTRNLINEFQYQVELSDIVAPGTISRLLASQSGSERDVRDINKELFNNSVLNNNVIGTLVFTNMPTTPITTGFEQVYIEQATGKLFRKV